MGAGPKPAYCYHLPSCPAGADRGQSKGCREPGPALNPARSPPMPSRPLLILIGLSLLFWVDPLAAEEPKAGAARTVEQLTEAVRQSVVVIESAGRDGKRE